MSEHKKSGTHEPHAGASAHATSSAKNDQSQLMMLVGALIVGLLIGGVLSYGMGFGAGMNQSASGIKTTELAPTLASYLNNNFLSPDAKTQGVSFVVEDGNNSVAGLAEFNVYALQNGQKQLAGVVYANNQKMIIAQGQAFDLNSAPATTTPPAVQTQEVPKSDKPKVELFVMSYCPYGTQMEKATLPVVSVLKDKIDFKVEYTHFTLHGPQEDTENARQMCIRNEQGDKFLPYLQCILDSNNVSAPGDQTTCMNKLGIDINAVNSCMSTSAPDYYKVDSALSQGYNVQGSPTLIINGTEVQSSRSPAAVLSTICSAFNIAPSDCNTSLPTAQASAGFGYNASSSADAAAIQCGV